MWSQLLTPIIGSLTGGVSGSQLAGVLGALSGTQKPVQQATQTAQQNSSQGATNAVGSEASKVMNADNGVTGTMSSIEEYLNPMTAPGKLLGFTDAEKSRLSNAKAGIGRLWG